MAAEAAKPSNHVHPKVVDLDDVVHGWAERMFQVTKTKDQGRISKDDLEYSIVWKKAHVTHMEPDYEDQTRPEAPTTHVLFRTTFTNTTNHEQEYSFKTERCTRSACEVAIEKGVMYGQELGLSLKLPNEILEIGAGLSREVSVTKSAGEVFEQELTWGVDSVVKVPRNTKTIAELLIHEDHMETRFTVKTKISGKVGVVITNRRDNNTFVKTIEGDIVEICKPASESGLLKGVNVENKFITYTTKGRCSFRFGIEQFVHLKEEALNDKK